MKTLRSNNYKGSIGESIAVRFLLKKSFKILYKNFITPFGEIDIVARKDGYTVFFEVKTRTSLNHGSPLLSITQKKQSIIKRNAFYYIKRHGIIDGFCRIDVIGIVLNRYGDLMTLEHIKNAVWV